MIVSCILVIVQSSSQYTNQVPICKRSAQMRTGTSGAVYVLQRCLYSTTLRSGVVPFFLEPGNALSTWYHTMTRRWTAFKRNETWASRSTTCAFSWTVSDEVLMIQRMVYFGWYLYPGIYVPRIINSQQYRQHYTLGKCQNAPVLSGLRVGTTAVSY